MRNGLIFYSRTFYKVSSQTSATSPLQASILIKSLSSSQTCDWHAVFDTQFRLHKLYFSEYVPFHVCWPPCPLREKQTHSSPTLADGKMYRVVQKKGTVLLSNSLAWPAVAGCSRAETFSQLSSISFAQPCTMLSIHDPAIKYHPKNPQHPCRKHPIISKLQVVHTHVIGRQFSTYNLGYASCIFLNVPLFMFVDLLAVGRANEHILRQLLPMAR